MRRVLLALKRIPAHPPLLAVAWVLNAYVASSPSPFAAVRALLAAVAGALFLTLACRLLLGSWARAGLAATAIIVVLTVGRDGGIMVGNIVRLLPAWQLGVLATVVLLSLAAAAYALRAPLARPNLAGRLGLGLSVFGVLLVIVIAIGGISRGTWHPDDLRQGSSMASVARSSVPRQGPDMYVLILDGYPSPDVLRERHEVDIGDFLEQMEARGFSVDPASHSNYLLTQLTLTSMLHMAQIHDIPALSDVVSGAVPGQPTARRVLNDNPVFLELRERDYAVVSYAIPFEHPALRQSDVLIELGGANEFERQLVASSLLLDLWWSIQQDPFADDLRAQISSGLELVPELAANRALGPRVVFAHILGPRPPFLFDASGTPITSGLPPRQDDVVSPDGLTLPEFSGLLGGQIAHINEATLAAIDGILAASPEPPVIVVMSDHGTRTGIDEIPRSPKESREAFGTIFAALTPGHQDVFPPGVTPAQVMPSLLNSYFGTQIPLASTETFASIGKNPFRLVAVPEPAPPPPP